MSAITIQRNEEMITSDATDSDRFTIDGSDALESHLTQTSERVLAGVKEVVPIRRLEALVLGGGYGRGQGGVLKTADGDEPYNDLEFYVFVRGNVLFSERRYRAALQELGERLSPGANVHVEFKVYSTEKLRRSPISMFTYDLAAGHKIIFGSEKIFDRCGHHWASAEIPMHEATRLLFNRCSGLLLAGNFLRVPKLTGEQTDFIGRNLAKARLALGDALLTVFGQYHWSCVERNERLNLLTIDNAPPWLAKVREQHSAGMEFKLHPRRTRTSRLELKTQHTELSDLGLELWLWIESRRLGRSFFCARDYALDGARKCPETGAWRNGLLNCRTFGISALKDSRIFRYPRERLFEALCLLLWDDMAGKDNSLGERLQADLRAVSSQPGDLVSAYQHIWQNYG